MPKILDKIGQMDDNALARLLGNAQALLEKTLITRMLFLLLMLYKMSGRAGYIFSVRATTKQLRPSMVYCQ